MRRKPTQEAVIVACAYLGLMLWTLWHAQQEQPNATNLMPVVLASFSSFFALLTADFALPPQFVPLYRLSLFGKIWRVIVALLAIAIGGVFTVAMMFGIGEKSVLSLFFGMMVFVPMIYIGVRMLSAR